jgi:hypothetical protein
MNAYAELRDRCKKQAAYASLSNGDANEIVDAILAEVVHTLEAKWKPDVYALALLRVSPLDPRGGLAFMISDGGRMSFRAPSPAKPTRFARRAVRYSPCEAYQWRYRVFAERRRERDRASRFDLNRTADLWETWSDAGRQMGERAARVWCARRPMRILVRRSA